MTGLQVKELADRYAVAAVDLAVDESSGFFGVAKLQADIDKLRPALGDAAVRKALGNPCISKAEKLRMVDDIAGVGKLCPLMKNTLEVMAQNGRLRILPQFLERLHLRILQADNSVVALVVSAQPLSKAQETGILRALENKTSSRYKIKLDLRIDKTLLAGVKINMAGKLYDSSLKSRLDALKQGLRNS